MTDRMTQIKFTIDSSIVAAFKAKCLAGGVSMTSVVSQWMCTCQPKKSVEPKPLTRPKRRMAVMKIIALLNEILAMEERHRGSIPEQFTQRHEWSQHACDHLAEAVDKLRDAFAP